MMTSVLLRLNWFSFGQATAPFSVNKRERFASTEHTIPWGKLWSFTRRPSLFQGALVKIKRSQIHFFIIIKLFLYVIIVELSCSQSFIQTAANPLTTEMRLFVKGQMSSQNFHDHCRDAIYQRGLGFYLTCITVAAEFRCGSHGSTGCRCSCERTKWPRHADWMVTAASHCEKKKRYSSFYNDCYTELLVKQLLASHAFFH